MDKKPVSNEQKEAYDRLLATHPDVERKGQDMLYTSVNGHMMKEYVTVPDALLEDTETLKPYLRMSYEYVTSLEPKPTTKSKKR